MSDELIAFIERLDLGTFSFEPEILIELINDSIEKAKIDAYDNGYDAGYDTAYTRYADCSGN